MGTYSFAALYQQQPVPTECGMFKRSWFTNNIVQIPPPHLDWKRGYDLSFNANPDSDYSATLKVAYDKDGALHRRLLPRKAQLSAPTEDAHALHRD
ncbi:hypothetical protein BH20ACI2_BH20ACI2_04090 [soil metagenome]